MLARPYGVPMPLTLITGPANAAKAGAVLERLRAVLSRSPVLVVPTAADQAHYARELARAGLVFGTEVTTFPWLMRDLARAAGIRTRPVGRLTRRQLVRAAIKDVKLHALKASARGPGFPEALGDLFAELQRSLATPARFGAAIRQWADAPAHANELVQLYSAYHARLDGLEAVDLDGLTHRALNGAGPAGDGRPLFFSGSDELLPTQLDLGEQLTRHTDTEVTVAVTYEPGRAATAGSASTVELLKPLAREHVALQPRSEHYAPGARNALHHLERSLFEPSVGQVTPNGAVRLLEAGGERAEAELVGASVLELLRDGMAAEDVAVLVRGRPATELFAQVFESYGIPVAYERRTPFAHTRLGTGVLAFARAALGGTANDVVTWLRTPGKLDPPDLADRLEVRVRRAEARSAADALWHWEQLGGRALTELDEVTPETLLERVLAEAEGIWTAPHVRRADVLTPEAESDARAARALRAAVRELTKLAEADPALTGEPGELLAALAGVEVFDGDTAAEGTPGVLLADPLAIRARRCNAVFVCGLQEGELPRRPIPEPFLDDDARVGLALASGLVLPRHEDTLARERSLFYACVSRPEEALFLSFRSSDEEGAPQQPSPFLDDVRALFTDELWSGRGRRLLAEVTWPPAEAPTPHELRRAQASGEGRPDPPPLAAPESAAVLAALAARDRESARGLEAFAGCPVRWLVEHLLRPTPVDPDPEPMQRGSRGHAVLERTLRGLKARTGSARLTPETLPEALAELRVAIEEIAAPPAGGARARAAARALEVDLERYLRHEATCGAGYEPARLEWGFGGDHDEAPALDVGGVAVSGRVDRIDVAGRTAVVRDYKGRAVTAGARWVEDGRVQAALYALAVRERLGLDVAGALYQPIGRADQRPRGLVRDDVPGQYVNGDVVDAETLDETLRAARDVAADAAAALRAARIRPCPERCSSSGTCAHPGICRS